jgi:hypothetical protein
MSGDLKYLLAKAWTYTFRDDAGFYVESRCGAIIHRAKSWEEAERWVVENIEQIHDNEESKG